MNKTIITLFITGLSFGSGPCIASCGPILISYIAGTQKNIRKGLKVYALFSLARIFVYLALGYLVFFLGRFTLENFLGAAYKYVLIIGGAFIVLTGILIALGRKLEITSCQFLQKHILQRDNKSIVLLGLIIGLLPCAPLIAILSYIGLAANSWINSLFYSLAFGMGTAFSPLIIMIILTGLIPKLFQGKKEIYVQVFNFICGAIIVFLGIQLILGAI